MIVSPFYSDAVKEGKAIGEAKGKLETAKNLIKIGLDKLQIAQATGLSIEQIEAL